ncbi:hypothetical protein MTO96_013738 [Rhipicephalus appendiculatus]
MGSRSLGRSRLAAACSRVANTCAARRRASLYGSWRSRGLRKIFCSTLSLRPSARGRRFDYRSRRKLSEGGSFCFPSAVSPYPPVLWRRSVPLGSHMWWCGGGCGPECAPTDRGSGPASNTCFGVAEGGERDVAMSGNRREDK